MRLLSSNFSPFSTRVRIQINKKQLPIDIVAPEPALRTPEFLAKYPLGKIPVLEFEDGSHLSESWSIMEYLEKTYPNDSLIPAEPLAQAHMNMMARFADLHLGPALYPMFVGLLTKQEIDKDKEFTAIRKELDKANRMLMTMSPLGERPLHLGDIALACTMLFTVECPKVFGNDNILSGFEQLQSWWQQVQQDDAVKQGCKEMQDALVSYLQQTGQA